MSLDKRLRELFVLSRPGFLGRVVSTLTKPFRAQEEAPQEGNVEEQEAQKEVL